MEVRVPCARCEAEIERARAAARQVATDAPGCFFGAEVKMACAEAILWTATRVTAPIADRRQAPRREPPPSPLASSLATCGFLVGGGREESTAPRNPARARRERESRVLIEPITSGCKTLGCAPRHFCRHATCLQTALCLANKLSARSVCES